MELKENVEKIADIFILWFVKFLWSNIGCYRKPRAALKKYNIDESMYELGEGKA